MIYYIYESKSTIGMKFLLSISIPHCPNEKGPDLSGSLWYLPVPSYSTLFYKLMYANQYAFLKKGFRVPVINLKIQVDAIAHSCSLSIQQSEAGLSNSSGSAWAIELLLGQDKLLCMSTSNTTPQTSKCSNSTYINLVSLLNNAYNAITIKHFQGLKNASNRKSIGYTALQIG